LKVGLGFFTTTAVGLEEKHSSRASGQHSDCLEVCAGAHVLCELEDGADPRRPNSDPNARDGRVLSLIGLIGSRRGRRALPQRGFSALEFWWSSEGLPWHGASFAIFAEGKVNVADNEVVVYIDPIRRSK
jgi:hypothetical protein